MASTSQRSSCLSLSSAGLTGLPHHLQPDQKLLNQHLLTCFSRSESPDQQPSTRWMSLTPVQAISDWYLMASAACFQTYVCHVICQNVIPNINVFSWIHRKLSSLIQKVDVGNLKTKQKQKVDFQINFIIKILKNSENHHIPKLTKK